MCSVDYDDGPSFLQDRLVKARKEHKCYECSRAISPGETYERTVARWDTNFYSMATCAQCVAGREWLRSWCGGFSYGNVLGETVEHWDEWAVEHTVDFGRLIIWIQRRWRLPDGSLLDPHGVAEIASAALQSTRKATGRTAA